MLFSDIAKMIQESSKQHSGSEQKFIESWPVTVAMFDPMAKDCVVAPAASEALVSNCRYSRESEYSLSKHTQHKLAPELYN